MLCLFFLYSAALLRTGFLIVKLHYVCMFLSQLGIPSRHNLAIIARCTCLHVGNLPWYLIGHFNTYNAFEFSAPMQTKRHTCIKRAWGELQRCDEICCPTVWCKSLAKTTIEKEKAKRQTHMTKFQCELGHSGFLKSKTTPHQVMSTKFCRD